MIPCWYQWNSDWSKLCIPYCTDPCAIRSGMLSCFVMSRMLSCTAAVLISTSDPGTRPLPSFLGTSRSDTTAASAVERRWRISSCWCGGKKEITRLIVCVQSVVWSVENTRCPVSAALSAVRSEEHTSELQSHSDLVCRLLLEKKKKKNHARTL